MNKPLVTIVTITFNLINADRVNKFKQCVESVSRQSYKNIEHIIIDGASADGTVEILKEYEKQGLIKYFSQPDNGIYDAMNKGIERASGKYIAFLNSDDFYNNEDAIKLSIGALESENADWSTANTTVLDKQDNEDYLWEGHLDFIPFGRFPNHQTLFVKTEILKNLGGFDLNHISMADNQLMMKLHSMEYKYVYLDEIIVKFRPEGFSAEITHNVKQDHIECFYELYKDKTGLTKEECLALYDFEYIENEIPFNLDLCLKLASYPNWQKIFLEKYISKIKTFKYALFQCLKKFPKLKFIGNS